MKYKTYAILLIVLMLAATALCGCSPRRSNQAEINWDLYGVWVSKDGTVGDKVDLSLSGTLDTSQKSGADIQIAEFSIQWPEGFRYGDIISQEHSVLTHSNESGDGAAYYQCSGASYDSLTNKSVPETFFLFLTEQFVVFEWYGQSGTYLVASTDPNADAQALLAYFLDMQ